LDEERTGIPEQEWLNWHEDLADRDEFIELLFRAIFDILVL